MADISALKHDLEVFLSNDDAQPTDHLKRFADMIIAKSNKGFFEDLNEMLHVGSSLGWNLIHSYYPNAPPPGTAHPNDPMKRFEEDCAGRARTCLKVTLADGTVIGGYNPLPWQWMPPDQSILLTRDPRWSEAFVFTYHPEIVKKYNDAATTTAAKHGALMQSVRVVKFPWIQTRVVPCKVMVLDRYHICLGHGLQVTLFNDALARCTRALVYSDEFGVEYQYDQLIHKTKFLETLDIHSLYPGGSYQYCASFEVYQMVAPRL
eukprot:TRINITY_DN21766_c0_g1_i1.p1 TRINITY_DN21766_c0_g1~~TRINITY_DN21766_c0_g1_i1.p1  ORF type:complete len:263 (-),score=28.71 TRINITY_DN21766_c0_g1_i1:65-853(-)